MWSPLRLLLVLLVLLVLFDAVPRPPSILPWSRRVPPPYVCAAAAAVARSRMTIRKSVIELPSPSPSEPEPEPPPPAAFPPLPLAPPLDLLRPRLRLRPGEEAPGFGGGEQEMSRATSTVARSKRGSHFVFDTASFFVFLSMFVDLPPLDLPLARCRALFLPVPFPPFPPFPLRLPPSSPV